MSYIYVCAGCDLLAKSERSDCMTCSPACRVRAHRSGAIKRLRVIAAQWHLPNPAIILHAKASERLLPDREAEMRRRAGERTPRQEAKASFFKDQPDIRKAFVKRVFEAARASSKLKDGAKVKVRTPRHLRGR